MIDKRYSSGKRFLKYTEQELENARNVDMVEFLGRREGFCFVNKSGWYFGREHDSLVINKDRHTWHWYSRDLYGKGAIDWLMKVDNMSFAEAAETLIGTPSESTYITNRSRDSPPKKEVIVPEKRPFIPPPRTSRNYRETYAYLCTSRKLPADIVTYCVQNSAVEMFDEEDYENLGTVEAFFRNILYTSSADSLYAYHIDYLETLILMIAVAVCLFLSGVKITVTMFEIMFSQIITPFVIATDLQNAGRSKKAIQNMLLSTIVLMIVVIILRLYIAVIWGVKDSKAGESFAVMIIVIIAGAMFVINGPDLLTKLFGIDAGVKSAAGTVMALTQMAQTGGFMAMNTARMGGSLIHAGTHMGGQVVKSAGGAVAGGVKGFAGGVYGGVTQGQTAGGKVGRAFAGAAAGTAVGTVGGAMGHSDIGAKAGYATAGATPLQNVKNTFEGGFKDGVKNIAGNAKDKIVGGLDKMVVSDTSGGTSATSAFSSTDNSSVNSNTAGSGAGFSSQTDNKTASETRKNRY